jgi:carboxyl-terminal processing protease
MIRGLVLPVTPAELVRAAWAGELAQAHAQGFTASPALPALGDDADQDLIAFNQARDKLLIGSNPALDASRLDHAAITSMAESVADCHTAYLSVDQWNSISADLAGDDTVDGLPMTFQLAPPFLVESVVDGSNAARQGVQAGDRILSVDGTPIAQIPLSRRKFLNAGGVGTSAQLALAAPNGQIRTLVIQREAVSRPVVSTELYGAVGYVRLRTFTTNLNRVLDPAISQLQAQGAQAFVLDLRGNLGGELNSVVHVLSRFIASGELADTNERARSATTVDADGSVLPGPPPLAVLIDGGSLSASELFASDIQQYQAGELVGTSTPGCLLGSTFRTLGDGSALQVSVLDVRVGPQKVVVNNAGVQPDVLVELTASDLEAGKDPQRERAITDMQQRLGH